MMLFGLLRAAPDALRADFRKHYNARLNATILEDWREAADMAASIPPDKSSAVFRKLNPDAWRWGDAEHLLAEQVDALRTLVWMKTDGATKKPPRGRPKPIPRPGFSEKQNESKGRFKDVEGMPLAEAKRKLAMPRKAIG